MCVYDLIKNSLRINKKCYNFLLSSFFSSLISWSKVKYLFIFYYVTGTCVLKRWPHLRDSWKKTLNQSNENKKSVSGVKWKPNKFDQELSFLKAIVKPGGTDDNNPNTTENECEQKDNDDTILKSSSKKARQGKAN